MKIVVVVVLITIGLVCSIATLPARQQDHVERHRGALGTGVVDSDAAAVDAIRNHLAECRSYQRRQQSDAITSL